MRASPAGFVSDGDHLEVNIETGRDGLFAWPLVSKPICSILIHCTALVGPAERTQGRGRGQLITMSYVYFCPFCSLPTTCLHFLLDHWATGGIGGLSEPRG